MYYFLKDQFLTFPNGESANAKLLTELSGIKPSHWWNAQPLKLPVSELVFGVHPQVTLFDNYPTNKTGIELYSQRFLNLLQQLGVRFQSFSATLIDIISQEVVSTSYAVFHLLEIYPAIDIEHSSETSLKLTSDFLRNPRPLFRPAEANYLIMIADHLRFVLDQAGITGCLYESIEKPSVAVALRRPRFG